MPDDGTSGFSSSRTGALAIPRPQYSAQGGSRFGAMQRPPMRAPMAPMRPSFGGSPGGGMPGRAMQGGQQMQRMAPPQQVRSAPMPQKQPQRPGGIMGAMGGAMGRPAPSGGGGGFMSQIRGAMGGRGGGAPQPKPGSVGAAGGAIGGMFSDERSKEKIAELEGIRAKYEALIDEPSEKPDQFRDVGSHEFSYKPEFQDQPGGGRGRFAGPMADELESIPGVVQRGPGGMKQVDPGRLSLANASATGELSRDMDALKARLAMLDDDPDAVLREAGGGR